MGTGSARLVGALALTAAFAAFAAGGASTATVDDTVVNALGTELQSLDATGGAVMLELAGEPSAVTYTKARSMGASKADAGKAGKASKERNEQAQGAVLADLQSAGIDATPLYQVQSAYNGIAVQAAPGTIDELAALPGVAAVHVIPLVELDNHSSVPLIGALQAWGSFGKTGTGMSIAVIDTGIDYVHRGFGGSGLVGRLHSSPAARPRTRPPRPTTPPASRSQGSTRPRRSSAASTSPATPTTRVGRALR